MCHGKGSEHHFGHGCFPFAGKDFPHMMKRIGRHIHECMGRFGSWVPYNLEKLETGYLIVVPLPGRTKEDVNVSLIGNSLNIKAAKPKTDEKETSEEKTKEHRHPFLKYFFTFIDVDMDIVLPADADLDSIKSIMSNGVLKIKLGKKPSRNIDVNNEGNN